MKKFIVMYIENMSPVGIYEAEAVINDAIISDKELMHIELPAEGWIDQEYEIISDSSGHKLQYK
jgi:hypothetical protein